MNIELAALPDDAETLQRMVRTLASERASLTKAQAEIERLIVQKHGCAVATRRLIVLSILV